MVCEIMEHLSRWLSFNTSSAPRTFVYVMPLNRFPPAGYQELMKPDEDWRDLTDNAERRKLQNRIAQRAYRRSIRARAHEVEALKLRIKELEQHAGRSLSDKGGNATTNSWNAVEEVVSVDQESEQRKGDQDYQDSEKPKNGLHLSRTGDTVESNPSSSDGAVRHFDVDGVFSEFLRSNQLSPQFHDQATFDASKQCPLSSDRHLQERQPWKEKPPHVPTSTLPSVRLPAGDIQRAPMTSLLDHRDHIGNARQHSDGVPSLMTEVDPGSFPLWPDLTNKIPQEPSVLPSPPMSQVRMDSTEAKGLLDDSRSSLLHLAIASGSAETLRFLLQNMEIFTSKRDAAGFTPLQRAVLSGRTDLVAILLDHGADLASDDEDSGPIISNG